MLVAKAQAERGANPEDALRALRATSFAKTDVGRTMMWLADRDKHGKVSSSAAGLGLLISGADLVNCELGKGTKKDVDAILSVMKAADAYAKWYHYRKTGETLSSKASVITRFEGLKRLGPAADIIGGTVDLSRSMSNWNAGNYDKAMWQLTSGVGQGVTAVGTIIMLAGASGPGWPFVVLIGTGVVLVGKYGEYASEKSPEVEFLRSSGLLAPPPPEVRAERSLVERLERSRANLNGERVALEEAMRVLRNPRSYTPGQVTAARDKQQRAQRNIWTLEASVAKAQKELASVRDQLREKHLNSRDWEGMFPEDIAARMRRNEVIDNAKDFLQRNWSDSAVLGP